MRAAVPGRRVVITGLGVISSLGHNCNQFWEMLSRGTPAIAPIESVDRSRLRFQNAAEVRSYQTDDYFDGEQARLLDRFTQFGLIAAREAVQSAGMEWNSAMRERTGVVTGSALGGQGMQDEAFAELYLRGRTRVHPLSIPRIMPNALASHITMQYGITGPAFSISTACSSANHAIGQAFRMIREGLIDAALAGGSEAPFSYGNLKAWEAMRVVSPGTCRPFSKFRDGTVLGEGGAMLVLECRDLAVSRGALIYGEIVGFGMSSDAYHITQPRPEGAAQAMKIALDDAQLQPEMIGYINAHGTGTQANDSSEAAAIKLAFGKHAEKLAVSSTKSMHGHTLGAAGALEAVATVLSLSKNVLPPTANFIEWDPECDLDAIPNLPREACCEYALSNSFGFGGLNAVLIFRNCAA
jgi:nodulation protein E